MLVQHHIVFGLINTQGFQVHWGCPVETSKKEKEVGQYVPFGNVRGTRSLARRRQAPKGRGMGAERHRVGVDEEGRRTVFKYLRE